MADKSLFQRRWIARGCGLFVFLTWFLVAVYLFGYQLLFGFAVDKQPSLKEYGMVRTYVKKTVRGHYGNNNLEDALKGINDGTPLIRASKEHDERRRSPNESRMRSDNPQTIIESSCSQDYAASRKRCAELKFDGLGVLLKASIIVTFHREETMSSLLHTVHSIVQRTPKELIEEIIIIDDFSQKDHFGRILEIYLESIFPSTRVNLHRNSANLGLIRSRLKGSRLSKGQVLVFMDSHSEVQTGWLEPLLFEIKKNRRSLVNSVIDWMEKTPENRWTYRYGCTDGLVVFDWTMGFGWNNVPAEDTRPDIADAYKSKTIIGTYAAIEKQFFVEIGEFDEGMEFWGAENIDLSIRVWLFNGQVLTVPCSRAAHLEGRDIRAYRNGHYSLTLRNYKRLAEVWFDEYKDCFYYYFPQLISVDAGNLSDRLKVKASAPHDFKWYLQNIYPELGCSVRDAFARGPVKNVETGRCLFRGNEHVATKECTSGANDQKIIYWSNLFHLRQPNYVLIANGAEVEQLVITLEYLAYYRNDGASKWIHWKDGPLMELSSMLCLEASSDGAPSKADVVLRSCNFNENARQTWRFEEYTDQYEDLVSNNQSMMKKGKEQQVLLHEYHLYGRNGT